MTCSRCSSPPLLDPMRVVPPAASIQQEKFHHQHHTQHNKPHERRSATPIIIIITTLACCQHPRRGLRSGGPRRFADEEHARCVTHAMRPFKRPRVLHGVPPFPDRCSVALCARPRRRWGSRYLGRCTRCTLPVSVAVALAVRGVTRRRCCAAARAAPALLRLWQLAARVSRSLSRSVFPAVGGSPRSVLTECA